MSGIFASSAPAYWAAGLSAIPLWTGQKRPIPEGWQAYAETPVPPDTQAFWLDRYPSANIGLVLGPASDLCMVDVDTDDMAMQGLLAKLLPPSPWERRGKKGCALAYRYSGFKTFRIKDASGRMIVECLSAGTQLVLPPSIHPDTKRAYEADSDLWALDVQARLMRLPQDIEAILRSALEEAGCKLSFSGHTRVTDYVASGARDVKMVAMAGLFTLGVLRGEQPFTVACDMLRAWHAALVEKVAGDDVDIEKGIARMAEFLIRDVTGPKKKPLPQGWDAGLSIADRTGFGFDVFTDLHSAWDYDRMKLYIRGEFVAHEPDSQGRRGAVNHLLERLVVSELDAKDEGALLKYVAMASECGYSEATLKRSLHKLRHAGIEGENQTQIAREMIAELSSAGEIAFVAGDFWQWLGSHWGKLGRAELLRDIALGFGHLPAAKRAGDHKGVMDTMANLVRREGLSETAEVGCNFANGFLTPDLALRPHEAMYGCTYTLPYRYLGADARGAPRFERFLGECWGHDPDYADKRSALQEALAVTMFGCASRLERAFCLHGPPKSGKSQLLAIVESLLPRDVCCSVGPESWGDKFLPAQMFGKLLNVAGELSEDRKIDGSRFKQIVSGETLTGQHKNGQPFSFRVRAAHWFASNHIPRTNDTSQGFTRRWLLLTYNKPVANQDKVLDLGTQIAVEEREEIVSWAVEAITRTIANGDYRLPASHLERIEEVAKANNALRTFLLDSGKVLIGAFAASSPTPTPETVLYNAYYTFALAAGDAKPVSSISFRQKMRELGSELGFQILVTRNAQGGQDCVYRSITLATGNVVALRKSTGTGSAPTSMSHST